MTAIMSPSSSPATSPPAVSSPSSNPNHPALPPLITSPPGRRTNLPRPMSHASKNRLSQYSTGSVPSRSRPPSYLFPIFHSSLTYTTVRDFAYPSVHPMHYGPPPEGSRPPSGMTTPISESRRLSDPPASWESKLGWEWTSDGGLGKGGELAAIHLGDGPPWSEDEDPADEARHSVHDAFPEDQRPRQYAEHDAGYPESEHSSNASSPGFNAYDESRYSRDYQFTITSPDEEMHGKAVALFDFARENENELPLVEGQIIWVSYRHGQGWLVAEDPKTQESGLVPEEYVRLLRDIEGGMNSLTGQLEGPGSPNDSGTPTQAEHTTNYGHTPTASTGSANGYHQPIVSTFSTSSADLNPYPQHLLGSQPGQAPPQVVHYHGQRGGSQANTPTVQSSFESGMGRRGSKESQDTSRRSDSISGKMQGLDLLSDKKLTSPVEESDSDEEEKPQTKTQS